MLLTNPFTGMVVNDNPKGCNQWTGPNCSEVEGMADQDFADTFGIHATEDPDKFEPADRLLEVTKPGKPRFFKHNKAVIVRDRRGRKILGDHYVAAVGGRHAEVISRDQELVSAMEQGKDAVVRLLRSRGL